VPSLSPEAVSNSRLDYHFADPAPLQRRNYYRLKMVDLDGKYTYSQIRVTASENSTIIYAYPNPAADELTIDGLNGSEAIKVLDIFGRTLIEGRNRKIAFKPDRQALVVVHSRPATFTNQPFRKSGRVIFYSTYAESSAISYAINLSQAQNRHFIVCEYDA
jgi:hypothetical protein